MANHKAMVVIDGCETAFLDVLRTLNPRIRNLMLKLEWDSEQAFVDFYAESHFHKYGQNFLPAADFHPEI